MTCLVKRIQWRWDPTLYKQVIEYFETWCMGSQHFETVFEAELADCKMCLEYRKSALAARGKGV